MSSSGPGSSTKEDPEDDIAPWSHGARQTREQNRISTRRGGEHAHPTCGRRRGLGGSTGRECRRPRAALGLRRPQHGFLGRDPGSGDMHTRQGAISDRHSRREEERPAGARLCLHQGKRRDRQQRTHRPGEPGERRLAGTSMAFPTSSSSSTSTRRARNASKARPTRWSPISCIKSADGKLAVVAVLLDGRQGQRYRWPPCVRQPAATRGALRSRCARAFDTADVLPAERGYSRVCRLAHHAAVAKAFGWFVLKELGPAVSKAQIAAFRSSTLNRVPVQPLNGRVVEQS